MNKKELLFEYILNRTSEGDEIHNMGDNEIRFITLDNLPDINIFPNSEDTLYNAIKNIIDTYLKEEERHYEESGKPENHIYKDLLTLRKLL